MEVLRVCAILLGLQRSISFRLVKISVNFKTPLVWGLFERRVVTRRLVALFGGSERSNLYGGGCRFWECGKGVFGDLRNNVDDFGVFLVFHDWLTG